MNDLVNMISSGHLLPILLLLFPNQYQTEMMDNQDQQQLITNVKQDQHHFVKQAVTTTSGKKPTDNIADDKLTGSTPKDFCYDSSASGRDSDCTKYGHLCDNKEYYNLMTWQCPVTCGRCEELTNQIFRPVPSTNDTCADLEGPNGRSDCKRYTNLCRDPRYVTLMKIECPRTCRFCSSN